MEKSTRKNWIFIGVLFISLSMLFSSFSFAEENVTGDIQLIKSRLYYDRKTKTSYLDVALKNISPTVILESPIKAVIESITPSSITIANPDGTTTGGNPYFLYTLTSGTLLPGQTSAPKRWRFSNPGQLRFTHSVSVVANIQVVNTPPVANAGPDQTVTVGTNVQLNGSGSTDVDGDPLTFSWSFTSIPAGSVATLNNPSSVNPTFIADEQGDYIVELIVNDGFGNSAPDTVTITTQNTPPVANAGPNQTVTVGTLVTLNGSGSTDVDGDPLTYSWSFTTIPSGSGAILSDPTLVNPTFTVDKPGTYVIQLIVNDGFVNSAPAR